VGRSGQAALGKKICREGQSANTIRWCKKYLRQIRSKVAREIVCMLGWPFFFFFFLFLSEDYFTGAFQLISIDWRWTDFCAMWELCVHHSGAVVTVFGTCATPGHWTGTCLQEMSAWTRWRMLLKQLVPSVLLPRMERKISEIIL